VWGLVTLPGGGLCLCHNLIKVNPLCLCHALIKMNPPGGCYPGGVASPVVPEMR